MNNLINIPFHSQTVYAIEQDGQLYIAMRPIVENLGLDWKSQHVKLTEKFNRTVAIITTVAQDGKLREMHCLPITKIAAYLYSINASKVKPELRDTIIAYQEECDIVLFNHFVGQRDAKYQALTHELTAMQQALFDRHPQWRETRDLYRYGFSTAEIADLQAKNRRNVQRMLIRIRAVGIDCRSPDTITANKRRMIQAGLLAAKPSTQQAA